MIFLQNGERVVAEVMELARLRISGILEVPPGAVDVSVQFEDGKIKPQFSVSDMDNMAALEVKYIQEQIAAEWKKIKPELESRLTGLRNVRYGYQKAQAEG